MQLTKDCQKHSCEKELKWMLKCDLRWRLSAAVLSVVVSDSLFVLQTRDVPASVPRDVCDELLCPDGRGAEI